jgi:5-methylcytosine-specific restriction endonuclease McrA
MTDVKPFTCIDCEIVGEQQATGRNRLRCQPCGEAHRSVVDAKRPWSERKARRSVAQCEACGHEYPKCRRDQRWCSQRCAGPNKSGAGPRGGLSPEARERQRLYWQAKNRRRRAAKRGGASEPYTLAEIAKRDQGRCQLCGGQVPMVVKVPELLAPTIDHIVPVSKGGDDTRANVQLAHFVCNSRKGARDGQPLLLSS